jgi:PTH1 family peptidyl-tRNA hydrolase
VKLVVGLGNPGAEYGDTRHNVGFMAVDCIARELRVKFKEKIANSAVGTGQLRGEKVVLAKPMGFMNLSGKSLAGLMAYFSAGPADLTVLHDDLDIQLGKIKVKKSGGSAGHNGIASIIDEIGTGDFRRLRIGIGRPSVGGDVSDYVLSPFTEDEESVISRVIEDCFEVAVIN